MHLFVLPLLLSLALIYAQDTNEVQPTMSQASPVYQVEPTKLTPTYNQPGMNPTYPQPVNQPTYQDVYPSYNGFTEYGYAYPAQAPYPIQNSNENSGLVKTLGAIIPVLKVSYFSIYL